MDSFKVIHAALQGDVATVRSLLEEQGMDVNETDGVQFLALL